MTEALKFYGGKESPPLNKKKKMPSLLHDCVQGSHPSCTSLNNRNISGNTRDGCILAKSIFHKGKKYVIKTCM